jgi:hypothetical protein
LLSDRGWNEPSYEPELPKLLKGGSKKDEENRKKKKNKPKLGVIVL